MVEADLGDLGVDVGDRALMESRPWRWLRVRVEGLLSRPPLGFVEEPAGKSPDGRPLVRYRPVWPNRLQRHFYGPAWGDKTA